MATRFSANSKGIFVGHGMQVRCAVGKGGVIAAADKREGDGGSPIGDWPMRRVFFRPDRLACPETGLPTVALTPTDGWCDQVGDPLYNQKVTTDYPARHEKLWRDDHVYDLIVELGYNDDPVLDGHGSAIFMHVARPEYEPTEGCIALDIADLKKVLALSSEGSTLAISDAQTFSQQSLYDTRH